ncbi:EscU/YscU/HrcU family type III secretion system export apparatus switch protein [Sphingomonas montana]|uniref:EscU/YscU/HrcU family type III secretion system export apparatus switch protein n=1 Tax=Sphingomonas montana TaxID=1843236 RepID=UPI00096CE664|nr:flagellar type III secretion system protein FlhB [Sphingomonas montana]
MSDAPDTDQKTEAPTEKRRRDSAEKGDVLQSRELGTALVVLAGAGWLAMAGPWMVQALRDMLVRSLRFGREDVIGFDPGAAFASQLSGIVVPLFLLLFLTMFAAVVTPALLGSLGFRMSAVGFKASKLNPLTGIKRIFGTQGLVELGKSLAKVVVLGGIGWWLIAGEVRSITGYGSAEVGPAIDAMGRTFVHAVLIMALALLLIAGVDVPAQVMQRAGRMRMTKQEVKDENKESDGNPEMKGQQRRRAAEVLRGSARVAVTEATVVLTNPTHFAIALRYRPGEDAAPTVVAKGRGETATAIRELAKEQAVPMLSYPQLARAIYFTSRSGQLVREDLYMAVATVLAFVFRLDQAMAEGQPQPVVDVPVDARFDEQGKRGA